MSEALPAPLPEPTYVPDPLSITRWLRDTNPVMRQISVQAPIDSLLGVLTELYPCIMGLRDGSIDREGVLECLDSAAGNFADLSQFRSVLLRDIMGALTPIARQWVRQLDHADEVLIIERISANLLALFFVLDNDEGMDPQTMLSQIEEAYRELHGLLMRFRSEIEAATTPLIEYT